MGTYVNPRSESMKSAVNSEIYVDKTGLLKVLNKSLNSEKRYFAVSRARRFGKSMAAGMIDAYYSRGCDSRELFEPYEIARDPDFEKYLNKYNVLHFDVASFYIRAQKSEDIIPLMDRTLLRSMMEEFPFLEEMKPLTTAEAMYMVYEKDRHKFIVIIDEYDCIVRDSPDDEKLILDYLRYLRGFFKTEESKQFLALGYITGILPIKKVRGESALNNFREFTMTRPDELVTYFGFTEQEVEGLCKRYRMTLESMRKWYDGYYMYAPALEEPCEKGDEGVDGSVRVVRGALMRLWHIYNPNSLVEALMSHDIMSYWKNTGSFQSLQDFITMNFEGLKDDIVHMLVGGRCKVDIKSFQNDLTQFESKDDVMACLVHMGYLGYDALKEEAFIPNKEVGEVFEDAVRRGDWDDVAGALRNSERLLWSVWDLDERRVADTIAASHQDYASIINYNDENVLSIAIMVSFYTARRYYHVVRELPTGKGYADIVFIPRADAVSPHLEGPVPAMIVELKWNRSARAAIKQIRDRSYTGALSGHKGEIILVGINYTKKTKKYTCRIERLGAVHE